MMKYDAIIIGFGKAGKTLAAHLAAKGERVALVEQSDRMYGGTCINVGCIPSKSLVNSAAASAAHPDARFEAKAQRYALAIEEKRRVTAFLRKKNFDKLNGMQNVTILHAKARFAGPGMIEATTAEGTQTLASERIFINTGATPVIPDIPGLADNGHVYYSDTLMELDALPRKLIIIGGGYVGLEFASMYAAFGSSVTVLQDGETFLAREDEDVAAAMKEQLEAQGVVFRLGSVVHEIAQDGVVAYDWRNTAYRDAADAILVATGRRPNTDGLNLPVAGIAATARGAIAVDEFLRTSVPGVWAMGDVAGGLQFTYVSLDDYRVVASQIDGGAYSVKARKNVPYSVFLATPFARVGLNEREARQAGYDVRIAKMPAAAVPKAQVLQKTAGLLKAVVDGASGKILGAMLLCSESYEMINTVKLAMDLGADYTVLRDQIFTHPTMSEALNDLFALVDMGKRDH